MAEPNRRDRASVARKIQQFLESVADELVSVAKGNHLRTQLIPNRIVSNLEVIRDIDRPRRAVIL